MTYLGFEFNMRNSSAPWDATVDGEQNKSWTRDTYKT